MSAADQGRARQALAFVAQTLRPDWDPPGIHAVIEALHRDRQTLGLIARATISAALTPSTRTPGGIAARIRDGFDGAETHAGTPTPPKVGDMRCPHCGMWVVRTEMHTCGRIADPHEGRALVQAELDAARAEIKPTVSYETEETSDG